MDARERSRENWESEPSAKAERQPKYENRRFRGDFSAQNHSLKRARTFRTNRPQIQRYKNSQNTENSQDRKSQKVTAKEANRVEKQIARAAEKCKWSAECRVWSVESGVLSFTTANLPEI